MTYAVRANVCQQMGQALFDSYGRALQAMDAVRESLWQTQRDFENRGTYCPILAESCGLWMMGRACGELAQGDLAGARHELHRGWRRLSMGPSALANLVGRFL